MFFCSYFRSNSHFCHSFSSHLRASQSEAVSQNHSMFFTYINFPSEVQKLHKYLLPGEIATMDFYAHVNHGMSGGRHALVYTKKSGFPLEARAIHAYSNNRFYIIILPDLMLYLMYIYYVWSLIACNTKVRSQRLPGPLTKGLVLVKVTEWKLVGFYCSGNT